MIVVLSLTTTASTAMSDKLIICVSELQALLDIGEQFIKITILKATYGKLSPIRWTS